MIEKVKKILPFFVGIWSGLSIYLIQLYPNIRFVVFVWFIWMIVVILVYKQIKKNIENSFHYLILAITTFFGVFSFVSLMEVKSIRLFLVFFVGLIMFILTSAFTSKKVFSTVSQKTLRRVMVMAWVFNAYSFLALAFALNMFFPNIPFWAINIIVGLVFGAISSIIWYLYYPIHPKYLLLWALIMVLIIIELVWVFHLLPFGFFVSAFFISWIWYIVQLFIRFHLSSQGIVWKNQIVFLSINGVLFLILLFLTRWV
ncbi:MAG: hypothetical protein CO137_01420 [Candidatus Magasanikbacteria bacterium CG_4_9_14_3_um_filter_32_9]|uniref:Uncharacterized protein n=1 Tax=Candidatus Magasanikbacteria bacterium CG_4_9_14_3_um_filter_32_9 TaxID=1974644 RepID=A0A2M7Z749_9BACT|nr:MAG: hypothetical protein CO137_01420 [Candidatus Magasanikbacteria bacterium CG_4_9_14_3_um_filter_32_9]